MSIHSRMAHGDEQFLVFLCISMYLLLKFPWYPHDMYLLLKFPYDINPYHHINPPIPGIQDFSISWSPWFPSSHPRQGMSLGPSSLHRAAADPLARRRAAADCAHGSHAARFQQNTTGKPIFGLHHTSPTWTWEILGRFQLGMFATVWKPVWLDQVWS